MTEPVSTSKMATASTAPSTVKISANLPSDAFQRLKTLAYERGVSMTEILRRAIEIEDFLDGVKKDGGKILIEDAPGKFRQILR